MSRSENPRADGKRFRGQSYGAVVADAETGVPRGLGLVSIPGLTRLMQDNRDSTTFSRLTGAGR
jgi:hypothetical protein